MRHSVWALLAICFVGCSSSAGVPDHVVSPRVCYVGELNTEHPLVPIRTEEAPVIQVGASVNEAVILGVLVHPDLALPSQDYEAGEMTYLEGCLGAISVREFGFREFVARVNWKLTRTSRVVLFLPDHFVTVRSAPLARLLIVTVSFIGVDPSAPRTRNFVVDLRDLPGAFDPSVRITSERLESGMKIFQGGLG
jgi:hypothetical protein